MFLRTLNVFAHGRADGEVNSQAMAEAMSFGKPIVSHLSRYDNGHVECIGNAGLVVGVDDVAAYASEMHRLMQDKKYLQEKQRAAFANFKENYELDGQMQRFIAIYESVLTNPFPSPMWRVLTSLHWKQNVRQWLRWCKLKVTYYSFGRI
jgi:glycosyltransferase involved in cell wall biosynthesis